MIHDLEESLCSASLADLVCAVLHPLLVSRQEVGEVNDWGRLVGRHNDSMLEIGTLVFTLDKQMMF